MILLAVAVYQIFLFSTLAASDPSNNIETDCRNCHGIVADRHHLLAQNGTYQCIDCHEMRWDNDSQSYYFEVIRNCLNCHTGENHLDCISCHVPGDVNISKFARHADLNITDGTGVVSNSDCWTCHYRKDMNRSHVNLCENCHINGSGIIPVTDQSLIISDFMHGITTCKSCHAPITYHSKGTVGPLGVVENILKKIQTY